MYLKLLVDILEIIYAPPPSSSFCPPLCQAVKGEMAPEYTDDQDEGKQMCTMTKKNHINVVLFFPLCLSWLVVQYDYKLLAEMDLCATVNAWVCF